MPSAPPLKGRRGDMARLHDGLVQDWIALAQVWGEPGRLLWGLENPQGSLCKRPYMKTLARRCNHRLVHYCAYGRRDQKPTHLWTNARWVPKGATGSGECAQRRCWAVLPGTRQHTHSVTGGTKRKRPAGQGSQAAKSAVPRALLTEMFQEMFQERLQELRLAGGRRARRQR